MRPKVQLMRSLRGFWALRALPEEKFGEEHTRLFEFLGLRMWGTSLACWPGDHDFTPEELALFHAAFDISE